MSSITDHKINGLNEAIEIKSGPAGTGGASTEYVLILAPYPDVPAKEILRVPFQNGPISGPDDMNGFTNESFLAMLIDRMRGFQSGPFACKQNELALDCLEEALEWMKLRTRDRSTRGVEGSLKP